MEFQMPSRKELKADAKLKMKGRKPSTYLISFVYVIILFVLACVTNAVEYAGTDFNAILSAQPGDTQTIINAVGEPTIFGQIINILLEFMIIVMGAGFTITSLSISRSLEATVGTLFDGFGIFFRVLFLYILEGIFIMLWSCLLVVPGIIAAYRYRMAMYILWDNPDMSAFQCIKKSKEMMKGHKWTLFVQDLSFILWDILAIIPFVSIYVLPYETVTEANFYNALAGYTGEGQVFEQDYTENTEE